jgi:hypothetical protein
LAVLQRSVAGGDSSGVAMRDGGLSLCELKPANGFQFSDALQDEAPQINQITGLGVCYLFNVQK